VRHQGSKALLEVLLREHPDSEVRGTACFALATLLKDEAKFGQNAKATAAAVQHFERASAEFGTVRWDGKPIGELAALELDELRRLSLGQPAPETAGQDLDGQPMRLGDYRGRVVVLVFWSKEFIWASEFRNLAERFTGEPFSVVGVFVANDVEAGRAEAERRGMLWRSFWDGRDGPIARDWNIRSWSTTWVLDRQGIIRHRDLRGPELQKAVEQLLKE
ncbi:MAG: TlpA family protein disulfide reductase, partial [Verrucomicrobiae bacterium]|nr:TlpA family protein disulfide reductase [Verrucomicrobiae bacterium]